MKCNKCNNNIPDDSEFCPVCGSKIIDGNDEGESENLEKNSARLFAIVIVLVILLVVGIGVIIYMIINNSSKSISENNKTTTNNTTYNSKIEENKIQNYVYNVVDNSVNNISTNVSTDIQNSSYVEEQRTREENHEVGRNDTETQKANQNSKVEEQTHSREEQLDTSFEMTSIELTSSEKTNTQSYTLRGKVNLKIGKDADMNKYSHFKTTINGSHASSSGDTIWDGYMWFFNCYNYLDEGENEFEVVVTDADGKSISKTFIVTYEPNEN